MEYVNQIMLNAIYVIFPILCYFQYLIYKKSVGSKENELFLDFSLYTSLYLSLVSSGDSYLLMYNIPLLIAYVFNRKTSVLLISVILIYYNVFVLDLSYFIIIEYLLYYLVYFFLKNRVNFKFTLVNICILFKTFVISYLTFFKENNYYGDAMNFLRVFIGVVFFYVVTNLIITILDFSLKVVTLNQVLSETEREVKIRESLFKVTHEIKNPLAVCKGYLDMFDLKSMDHCERYIPIIKEEINRTLVLLDDFRELTKVKIVSEIMDLCLLVEDVTLSLEPLFKSKNIKTEFKYPIDEVYILGDYNRLKQVLVNLFKNSVEAINSDGIITLDLIVKKSKVEIKIFDNGCGMSEEVLSKLSEAFFTTKESGTGLGVCLSKEIISLHGGTIEYKSVQNKFTEVLITMPINDNLV